MYLSVMSGMTIKPSFLNYKFYDPEYTPSPLLSFSDVAKERVIYCKIISFASWNPLPEKQTMTFNKSPRHTILAQYCEVIRLSLHLAYYNRVFDSVKFDCVLVLSSFFLDTKNSIQALALFFFYKDVFFKKNKNKTKKQQLLFILISVI